MGFNPGKNILKRSASEIRYLLGADFPETLVDNAKAPAFTIYQGHHGSLGAQQADVILPSTSYVEKSGRYAVSYTHLTLPTILLV